MSPAFIFSIAARPDAVNIIVPATKHFIVEDAAPVKIANAFTPTWKHYMPPKNAVFDLSVPSEITFVAFDVTFIVCPNV